MVLSKVICLLLYHRLLLTASSTHYSWDPYAINDNQITRVPTNDTSEIIEASPRKPAMKLESEPSESDSVSVGMLDSIAPEKPLQLYDKEWVPGRIIMNSLAMPLSESDYLWAIPRGII